MGVREGAASEHCDEVTKTALSDVPDILNPFRTNADGCIFITTVARAQRDRPAATIVTATASSRTAAYSAGSLATF